jgi:hypothetical protein
MICLVLYSVTIRIETLLKLELSCSTNFDFSLITVKSYACIPIGMKANHFNRINRDMKCTIYVY